MLVLQIEPGLELRQLTVADAEALAHVEPGDLSMTDGEWFVAPGGERQYLCECEGAFARGASLDMGIWVGGVLAGCLGLHHISAWNRSADLDYALGGAFRGRGLMTRSCRTLVGYAFREMNLERVQIECDVANGPSCRVAERLGCEREGMIRHRYFNGREFRDCIVYGLLSGDWPIPIS